MKLKKLIIFMVISQLWLAGTVFAQTTKQPRTNGKISKNITVRRLKEKKLNPVPVNTPEPLPTREPENIKTVVEPTSTPFPESTERPEKQEINTFESLGGLRSDNPASQVEFKVTSNGNANIKIGLAERGVTVIEFPAADPVYKIYPGDENYVTVDCGGRDRESRCLNSPTDSIVLRPGKMFSQWNNSDDLATVISVQRVSGIIVSFVVVPVRQLSQHTFHVVVRYDLAEVLAHRQAAGLTFQLNQLSDFNGASNKTPEEKNKTSPLIQNVSAPNENNNPLSTRASDQELEQKTVAELKRVAASATRLYFSKPLHGLSLAIATSQPRTTDYVIEVVAVKNTGRQPLRLAPEQPELFIDAGSQSQAVMSQRLPIVVQATTAAEDEILMPNQVYYFAFAYQMPILGAKQVLKVGFASREATDEPAVAVLLGFNR